MSKLSALFNKIDTPKFLFLTGILLFLSVGLTAQIEKKGTPRSLSMNFDKSRSTVTSINGPDLQMLMKEDNQAAIHEKPYRVGVDIPVSLDIHRDGSWNSLADGSKLWMLEIKCEGAQAIGVDFGIFDLPPSADFFISNIDYSHIAGAFTGLNQNTDRSFTVRPVSGDFIRMEYHQSANEYMEPDIHITGLNFLYRGFERNTASTLGFGGSDDCEINTACNEGANWTDQANGVVRILTRVGGQSFWCTGSLIISTAMDFKPLLLTANHCARNLGFFSSPSDMLKWVFYFRYESTTCENPVYEPHDYSMTGATRLAASQNPDEIGSDFYLLQLIQQVPSNYNAYYNGWNIDGVSAENGVCIHHPQGDIKKISTYSRKLESGNWQSIPNTHWIVEWSPTINGYGVTEAGSSGSPLFDSDGLLIGTLTGGESACSYQEGKDFYGKFSFSWNSNGSVDSMKIQPWLDPVNSGRTSLEGAYNNLNVVADFKSDTSVVVVGSSLNFTDLSLRNPLQWKWEFEGAIPSTSTLQNPTGIRYDTCGKFGVKLVVANQYGVDSLIKSGYVEVKSILYPNPSLGEVTIFTNSGALEQTTVNIFDAAGRFVTKLEWDAGDRSAIHFELPRSGSLFFIQVVTGTLNQVHKVVVLRENPD